MKKINPIIKHEKDKLSSSVADPDPVGAASFW
jgi:hypothetical protein